MLSGPDRGDYILRCQRHIDPFDAIVPGRSEHGFHVLEFLDMSRGMPRGMRMDVDNMVVAQEEGESRAAVRIQTDRVGRREAQSPKVVVFL